MPPGAGTVGIAALVSFNVTSKASRRVIFPIAAFVGVASFSYSGPQSMPRKIGPKLCSIRF